MQSDIPEWQWSHYDENGEQHWTSYSEDVRKILTDARRQLMPNVIISDSAGVEYMVSFRQLMTQQRRDGKNQINAVRIKPKLPDLTDTSNLENLDLSPFQMPELTEMLESALSLKKQTHTGHYSFPHALPDYAMARNTEYIFRTVTASSLWPELESELFETQRLADLTSEAWVNTGAKNLARSLPYTRVSTISASVAIIFETAREGGHSEAILFKKASMPLNSSEQQITGSEEVKPLVEVDEYSIHGELDPALSLWEHSLEIRNTSTTQVKVRLLHPYVLDHYRFFSTAFVVPPLTASSSDSSDSSTTLATSSVPPQSPHKEDTKLEEEKFLSKLKTTELSPWANEVEIAAGRKVDLKLFYRPLDSREVSMFHHLIQLEVEPVTVSAATLQPDRPKVPRTVIGLELRTKAELVGGIDWDLSKSIGHMYLGPKLGSGGFGNVYEVNMFGCTCAMKICSRDGWEREKSISECGSPNVMPMLGTGHLDTTYFLLLKKGNNKLRNLLKKAKETAGSVDPGLLIFLLQQVTDGIKAIHEQNFVHRDIKSDNIMITEDKAEIIDFGLAKPLGANGKAAGTVPYMDPEVKKGGPAMKEHDIYSFGVLLFEVAHLHIEERYYKEKVSDWKWNPSRVFAGNMREELGNMFRQCTDPEPSKRPSMSDIYEALGKYVEEMYHPPKGLRTS